MIDLTKLNETEVHKFQLVVLRDNQVQRIDVIIYQFVVFCEPFDHINSLQEQIKQLFISVEKLLSLSLFGCVVWTHCSSRPLVVLRNEVLQCQL